MNRISNNLIPHNWIKCVSGANKMQWLATTLFLSILTACASTPPPNLQMAAAEIAITHADQKQIPSYASPELSEARIKLTQARAAIANKEMLKAERLAEQAELDANLASARSITLSEKLVNEEMLKSTSVLKDEMQRKTGGPQ